MTRTNTAETSPRAPTVSGLVAYLEDVAQELSARGVTVGSIEVGTGRRTGGRLLITGRAPAGGQWRPDELGLVWHPATGWWTERGARRASHRFVVDADIAPANLACLVCDLMT